MIDNYMKKIKNMLGDKRNKKYIVTGLIVLFTICFFLFDLGGLLGRIFTSISNLFSNVDGEVKQVVIKSDGYDEGVGGSIQITKSADWVYSESSKLVLDVASTAKNSTKPKDVVIIIDEYAGTTQLQKVKEHVNELIEQVLLNENNKIGIISYSTSSKILTNFTADGDILKNVVNGIEFGRERSYYQALLKLEEMLSNYMVSDDRDLVVLFIALGSAGIDKSNHSIQYQIIKEKYPSSTIYGIDYSGASSLISISDVQVVVEDDINPLLEPGLNHEYYELFEIIEYINNDYFYVDSVDDINVSFGSVVIEKEENTQKIVWTADKNEFRTGHSATMEIILTLNNELIEIEGLYPTSSKTKVIYKLVDDDKVSINSDETPILKNGYKVVYNPNLPNGCDLDFSLEEIYYPKEEVIISNEKLECSGWQFQGWKIIEDVDSINDVSFIMGSNNVEVHGIWSKFYLDKSLEGNIVSSSKTFVLNYEYTGNYQTFEAPYTGTYKIELWGAQGGPAENSVYEETTGETFFQMAGGYGAYTAGEINLNKGTKLYIYIGNYGYEPDNLSKPFNGGGAPDITGTWTDSHTGEYSGGGATDVRLVSGDWDNFNSLKSRIMVAAGGSGGNNNDGTTGGPGGGLTGLTNSDKTLVSIPTQTGGYLFGTGQESGIYPNTYVAMDGEEYIIGADAGAGGGGYYGGYRGFNTNSGGSSGSSFISGHDGCDAISSSSTSSNIIHTGQSIHYSGYQFTNTVMIDGEGYKWTTLRGDYVGMPTHDGKSTMDGNKGNGYAKITFLG